MGKRRKKNKTQSGFKIFLYLVIVALLLGVGYYYYNDIEYLGKTVVEQVKSVDNTFADEINMADCLPQGDCDIVRHKYYVLGYSEEHEQAVWVYYTPCIGKGNGKASRTNDFREDPVVETGSADPIDYKRSGYDRGHLCPAGDMTLSQEAMSETFFMSNMSPQVPSFNRGIWKKLEEQVRIWGAREVIWVVTGPVFKDVKGEIGVNKVTVPGYYYKVVYSPSRKEMIGFIMPNAQSKKSIVDYVVSVDSVEVFTGLDFFPQLPDALEDCLEAASNIKRW